LTRLEHLDDRAEVGPIVWLDLSSAAGTVRITGKDPVAADIVVLVVAGQRAHHSQFVRAARGARQQLAKTHPWNGRRDGPKRSADFAGRIRLGIEGLMLGGP